MAGYLQGACVGTALDVATVSVAADYKLGFKITARFDGPFMAADDLHADIITRRMTDCKPVKGDINNHIKST
jgi:hypothetical protein